MNKTVAIIGLIIILAIGGFVLFGKKSQAPDYSAIPDTTVNVDTTLPSDTTTTPSNEPAPKSVTVSYTDSGFTPKSVTILEGDTVIFTNNSSKGMWVASDPHPQHTDFSAFDARKSYASGESYSFTFSTAGTYGYHNHASAADKGTIVVVTGK